ncbi:unnamed protein product [Chrysoparadoxa australica]
MAEESWDWGSGDDEAATNADADNGLEKKGIDEWDFGEDHAEEDAAEWQRARRAHFLKELQLYLQDLCDPEVRDDINAALGSVTFSGIMKYYDGKSGLGKYTVDTEVSRMGYRVLTDDVSLSCNCGAGAGAGESEGELGHSVGGVDDVRHELGRRMLSSTVLRMANQSIFGEFGQGEVSGLRLLLPAVTSTQLTLHAISLIPLHAATACLAADMLQLISRRLMRADLSVSVICTNCRFTLDFRDGRDRLDGASIFVVNTVDGLEIAQMTGNISIDASSGKAVQVLEQPQVRMVFDDALSVSAGVLAEEEARGGGSHAFHSDPGELGLLESIDHVRGRLVDASTSAKGLAQEVGSRMTHVVRGLSSAVASTTRGSVEEEPLTLYRRDAQTDAPREKEEGGGSWWGLFGAKPEDEGLKLYRA